DGDGAAVAYGELIDRVGQVAERLRREAPRRPVFHLAANTPAAIALYLGCLEAGVPVVLLEPAIGERLRPLLDAHGPDLLLLPDGVDVPEGAAAGAALSEAGYRLVRRHPGSSAPAPHPDLALLLATSGSTGNPKLVRLTRASVLANARSIATYLELG